MIANYHTHTMRCKHAEGEDREYVEKAIECGFRILGFSDHCPWIFPDGYVSKIRMTPQETDGYFASLEALKREYARDITIAIGFEAEYLPELLEDQAKFLAQYPVDYTILGQHYLTYSLDRVYTGVPTDSQERLKAYAKLCMEGMRTGNYLYLAHPDLINYTGPDEIYEKHMLPLCRLLKELNIPVEINLLGLWDKRNYPNERFLSLAQKAGNSAVLAMDAHAPDQLAKPAAVEEAKALCKKYALPVVEKLPLP